MLCARSLAIGDGQFDIASPLGIRGRLIKGSFIRAGLHFERLDEPPVLRPMARPGADVSEAELLWKRTDTAPVEGDSQLLCDALEVDTPPRLRVAHSLHVEVRIPRRILSSETVPQTDLDVDRPAILILGRHPSRPQVSPEL